MFLGVRKPFFMSKKEWKGLAWPGTSRTIRESLIDELVDLPELLHTCSKFERELGKGVTAVNETAFVQGWHLLHTFRQFEMRLNSWRDKLEEQQGSSLYWKQSSSNPVSPMKGAPIRPYFIPQRQLRAFTHSVLIVKSLQMPLSSTNEIPNAIFFLNPLIAESITLYWAGLLLLYLSALDIYNLIQFHTSNETPGSKMTEKTYFAFFDDFEAHEIALWQPRESDARKLANQLGQSLEYMNGEAFKPLNGARLACVPLWPAMRFFVRYPGPELPWLQRMAQSMSEKTGLQYVSKIASNTVDIFMQNAERNGP